MSAYIDSIILLILCFFICPVRLPDITSLTIILLLLSLYCFLLVIKNKKLRLSAYAACFALFLFFPGLSVFLPFFCYIIFYNRKFFLLIPYSIPLILYLCRDYKPLGLLIFPLLALSFYLSTGSKSRNELHKTLYSLRDNSVEKEMYLKSQNRSLLENQDNQVYIATLKERNRIAREIHDNVGHILSRSILHTGAMLSICRDENLKPHLKTLKENLDMVMDSIRSSVHDLHDESIDLPAALKSLTESFDFCPLSFQCDMGNQAPRDVKYCFLAIAKEALNNIIRHSNATKASIIVKEHPAFFQLLIEDNGNIKNKKDSLKEIPSGIGLSNMKERVDALNGILNISNEQGFRIFVSIPKQ